MTLLALDLFIQSYVVIIVSYIENRIILLICWSFLMPTLIADLVFTIERHTYYRNLWLVVI